jgi:hypothetical protein
MGNSGDLVRLLPIDPLGFIDTVRGLLTLK